MKILIVGGTGTIGSAVVETLRPQHEVVAAGHSSGDVQVDLADPLSIEALFETVGEVDAVVSCAGEAVFGPLDNLSDDDFALSLSNKLMGQVNLVRYGIDRVHDEGSFTLTSGVLSREPTPGSAVISLVNAGVEAFARAAALELPRGVRINVVSPPWVSETLAQMDRNPSEGLSAATVADAYAASVEGTQSGATIDARDFA